MGWFSRKSRGESDDSRAPGSARMRATGGGAAEPAMLPFEGTPVTQPLSSADRTRIAERLDALSTRGVDVDDLAAIGAAYDAARAEEGRDSRGDGADRLVDLFAVAIGEHLARHSAREWAMVTDAFGTDLGLVAARSESVVVPHNLVSARWMRGELGWVPGVVGHLLSLHPRP